MANRFGLVADDFRAAASASPVGVDLCCQCLCQRLCRQTEELVLSLLAECYNTANASSDPWNLPSIEMNHTDGPLCNLAEPPIHQTCSECFSESVAQLQSQNESDLNFPRMRCSACSISRLEQIQIESSLIRTFRFEYTFSLFLPLIKKWFCSPCMVLLASLDIYIENSHVEQTLQKALQNAMLPC